MRKTIEALAPGFLREAALRPIHALDCAANPTRESCDFTPPPVGAAAWQKSLEEAAAGRRALEGGGVEDAPYRTALAAERTLACSGGENAVHVVRGAGFQSRLWAAGSEAATLIDDLANKDSEDCPVAAALTEADRAALPLPPAKESAPPGPAYSP